MRLRHSTVGGPGLRRIRRGRGFSYLDDTGATVSDPETLRRIEALVIPPAWKKVWICPYPNGHIQAVGTDAAGRRQYLYHAQWQEDRREEKFDRVLELSGGLADWRNAIATDLRRRGLTRDRVLALGLRLLDLGYFRAGGDQYAEENNSFGIATLLREHITLRSEAVEFDYPAKSGIRRTLLVEDPAVTRAVRSLQRSRGNGDRLLAYRRSREWTEVHAEDLNLRFKEMVGEDYTVKDLRTWHGTVLAAEAFVDADPPVDDKCGQAGRIRGDAGGGRGIGQHPRGGPQRLRRPPGGRGIPGWADHRRRGAPCRSYPQQRQAPGDPGGQYRPDDPKGGQLR